MGRLKDLEETIKYKFNSKDLLKRSLTHKSFDDSLNNEKLEFLGDRVLGLIIAKNLFLCLTLFANENTKLKIISIHRTTEKNVRI